MVPFGVWPTPAAGEPVLRGVVEGIRPDDDVVIGVAASTTGSTADADPGGRPGPAAAAEPAPRVHGCGAPEPRGGDDARGGGPRELSAELGLTGVHVFFSDSFASGWVPYEERGRYLAEATLAVSTHHDHIETEFSFRTRMLDYFWAGLPVVTTKGDALADVVAAAGAGVTVEPGTSTGWPRRWCRSWVTRRRSPRPARRAPSWPADHWPVVAEPLLEFCRAPYRAPDLADPVIRADLLRRLPPERPSIRARWTTFAGGCATTGSWPRPGGGAPRLRRLSRRPAAP